MKHIPFARALSDRLGKSLSTRIGRPVKTIKVTETISEKARRVVAECDAIFCK